VGVPAVYRRAQCRWEEDGTCDTPCAGRGDRTSDRRDPSSRFMRPGSASGRARVANELARSGESGREAPAGTAPAAVGERTRKEATARESGYGSPGRESSGGALQGRERHERRPRSVGGHGEGGVERPRRSRELAGTVERGKNPEDGTDEGLAILVPHVRPQGSAWWRRGTRRSCVRGSKNLTRGRPARSMNGPVPSRRGRPGERTGGRRRRSRSSGEDLTPRG